MEKDHYGSAVVAFKNGRILLRQEDETNSNYYKWEGQWSIPMGHKDPGESRDSCALREYREETGYQLLLPISFVGAYAFGTREGGLVTIDLFVGEVDDKPVIAHRSIKEVTIEEFRRMAICEVRFPSFQLVDMVEFWMKRCIVQVA